jgi:putative spermidine/putrescine transport system substrate-binding protein
MSLKPSPSRRLVLGGALSMPFIRPSWAQQRSLTFMGYSGIFQTSYQKAVLDPFMKAHPDIKVNFYSLPNSAQMLGTLRAQKAAPQIDVCLFDSTFSKTGLDEDIITPLGRDAMPVMADLDEHAFRAGVGGPAVTYDNLTLVYSPPQVQPAPTSWKVLWDKKYDGKIAIPGMPDLTGAGLVFVANHMDGADYTKTIDPGMASVAEMAPLVLNWDPKPDPYTFVIDGRAALGVGWNARGQIYTDQNPGRIAATLPNEGSFLIINTINLIKNAPNTEAAKQFLAYTLSPEAQVAFADLMYYAPTNTKAVLSKETQARIPVATPEGKAKLFPLDWMVVVAIRDKLNQEWRRKVLTRG